MSCGKDASSKSSSASQHSAVSPIRVHSRNRCIEGDCYVTSMPFFLVPVQHSPYIINPVLLWAKRNTDYMQSSQFIVSLIKVITV